MNNIKWYYEAKSQKELDYLLEYCEKIGLDISPDNYCNDFIGGWVFIGLLITTRQVYAAKDKTILQGELTTDIEVFKSQFKAQTETKADFIAQHDALNERIAEMEDQAPLILEWTESGVKCGTRIPVQPFMSHGIWVETQDFDMKTKVLEDGSTILTLHKKQS